MNAQDFDQEEFDKDIRDLIIASIRRMQDLSLHLATASVGVVGVLGPVLLATKTGNPVILRTALVGFVAVIVSAIWGVRRSLRYEIHWLKWWAETPDDTPERAKAKLKAFDHQKEAGDGPHTFAFWTFVVSMVLLIAALFPWSELLAWSERALAYLGERGVPTP